MERKPKCIIVTGRQGSGKSTLAAKLASRLWMPLVSRDEIKEGYVNTFGVSHDALAPESNRLVTDIFFRLVEEHLSAKISIVIEAAFQHKVWEYMMPRLVELADVRIVLCTVDLNTAAERSIRRGLEQPEREFHHGDNRVVHYKKTGEVLAPADYEEPRFSLPTIMVSTDGEYPLDDIVHQIRSRDEHKLSVIPAGPQRPRSYPGHRRYRKLSPSFHFQTSPCTASSFRRQHFRPSSAQMI